MTVSYNRILRVPKWSRTKDKYAFFWSNFQLFALFYGTPCTTWNVCSISQPLRELICFNSLYYSTSLHCSTSYYWLFFSTLFKHVIFIPKILMEKQFLHLLLTRWQLIFSRSWIGEIIYEGAICIYYINNKSIALSLNSNNHLSMYIVCEWFKNIS